jgi:hypothetical protein
MKFVIMKEAPGCFIICFIPDKIEKYWVNSETVKLLVSFRRNPLVIRRLRFVFYKE